MNNSSSSPSNPLDKEFEAKATPMSLLEDKQLILLIQEGDEKLAFTELIKRYQIPVYSLLYNLAQKAEVADDLTQTTFIKAWKSLPIFEGRSKFSTWVFRIAHNVFYDYSRKKELYAEDINDQKFQQNTIDSSFHASEASPDDALIIKEQKALFKKAVSSLSEEQRTVLMLKEVQGYSYKEIAEITETSTGTVMSRLHYARQNLRTILNSYGQ